MNDPIRPLTRILTTNPVQPDQRRNQQEHAKPQPDDVVELSTVEDEDELDQRVPVVEPLEALDFEA